MTLAKTMRKLLLIAVIIATNIGATAHIPANVLLCTVETQVPDSKIIQAVSNIKAQGCNNATWQHIGNNMYIVYGTKVLISE